MAGDVLISGICVLIILYFSIFVTLIGKDYIYPGIFPMKSETHGGDDVGVFALGNLDLSLS